mmetsp:Transcript_4340/g.17969  ORF Transcript_4340/g.17969 Transcript_4340/m.17969 type:complete len:228 (+) Transcript_4340:568-1251(+)
MPKSSSHNPCMSSETHTKFLTSRIVASECSAESYGFFVICPRMNSSCVADLTSRREYDASSDRSSGRTRRASHDSTCPAGAGGAKENAPTQPSSSRLLSPSRTSNTAGPPKPGGSRGAGPVRRASATAAAIAILLASADASTADASSAESVRSAAVASAVLAPTRERSARTHLVAVAIAPGVEASRFADRFAAAHSSSIVSKSATSPTSTSASRPANAPESKVGIHA